MPCMGRIQTLRPIMSTLIGAQVQLAQCQNQLPTGRPTPGTRSSLNLTRNQRCPVTTRVVHKTGYGGGGGGGASDGSAETSKVCTQSAIGPRHLEA